MTDNQTLRELYARKSVRAFTDEPVTKEEQAAILEAAFQAPTAGNQQLYTILNITDPDLRRTLADLCDHQPMITKAPFCLVFLADCRRWPRVFRTAGQEIRDPGPGDLLLAVADSCIAAQNAVTAAESLGIGSCYIGDVLENCEAMRKALHLPAHVVPAAMLIFGRPTQQQKDRAKPVRFPREAVVCENLYRDRTEEELRADFAARAGGEYDFDAKIPPFCAFKYNSDFSKEMSRSAAVYLKDFTFGVE
ncbi:nitroreductase family protein [uncultured Gemmiger sp.]|uniref:nitroreductase family protein n=1 Tax=uncultured Gemmiger sp. TaxID=1623490 RepID=UPI0025FB4563|nr:nitroreductase family protein [uncultured Gemmiger sp.]